MRDVCERKHQGAAESVAAHKRRDKRRQGEVLTAIMRRPVAGITCRELAEKWGVGMNAISGRFSELHQNGLIVKAGRRDGCAIWKESR